MVTLTAGWSPAAVPASPPSVGVALFVGDATGFSVTGGGVVSTTNVRGLLLPALPAVSLRFAPARRSPDPRCGGVYVHPPPPSAAAPEAATSPTAEPPL